MTETVPSSTLIDVGSVALAEQVAAVLRAAFPQATLQTLAGLVFMQPGTTAPQNAAGTALLTLLQRLAQERSWQEIFEHVPLGLYRTTPDGQILAANQALLDLLGYPDLATLQASIKATDVFVDPADRTRQMALLARDGALHEDEVRWRRRDGTIIWVRDTARAVFDEQGQVVAYEGAVQEVTERRHAREELQRERDFINAVLHTVGAIIVILDPQGYVMRCNRAFEQLFHYTENEIRGKLWNEVLLAPEEVERVGQIFQRLRAGHLPSTHEYYCLTREGERRLVAWSNNVLRDASGSVTHILITGIDVTERKEAEERLRVMLERYRSVVQNVREYIYSVELVNGRTVSSYHSPRCVEVTGYTPEDYQRDPELWVNMIHPEDRDWVGAQFLRVMAGDTSVPSTIEHRIIRRDGQERWIANTFTAVRSEERLRLDGFILDITERRRLDEELERRVRERTAELEAVNARLEQEIIQRRRSETLLRSLFEQANDAIFIEDETGQIIDANPRACALLGYTRDELLRLSVHALQTPETSARLAAVANDRTIIEGVKLRKDGTPVPVEISTTRLTGLERNLTLTIVRDISERKQAETALQRVHEELEQRVEERTRALQHALEQLRTLYLLGQVINAARDVETILNHLIAEAVRVTGASHGQVLIANYQEEVFERRAQRGFSPEELERARRHPLPLHHGINARALRTGHLVYVPDVRQDPEYFPLIPSTRSEMAIPLIASGVIIGNLDLQSPLPGAFDQVDEDYLQALAAQGALAIENARLLEVTRQAREDWETTFDTLHDALVILDESGRVIRANRVWDSLSAAEREALLAWMRRPGLWESQPELLDLGQRSFEVQRYLLRTVPQKQSIGSVRDVTERRRMEQALIRAERLTAMGTLAAALAHEINNPLQAIKNSIELVLDFPLREEERRRHLAILRQEVERLIALVQQVLDYTRPAPTSEPRPLQVLEVLQYALALVEKKLETHAIRVTLDVPVSVPPVMAVRESLTQVFLNLIVNAIEAMPNGGELRIRVWRRRHLVRVAFRDTGPGLSAEAVQHLFEPFFTTKPGGSGLGLPISRNLVEQCNGHLEASNARDGSGAVFTVSLPIAS